MSGECFEHFDKANKEHSELLFQILTLAKSVDFIRGTFDVGIKHISALSEP